MVGQIDARKWESETLRSYVGGGRRQKNGKGKGEGKKAPLGKRKEGSEELKPEAVSSDRDSDADEWDCIFCCCAYVNSRLGWGGFNEECIDFGMTNFIFIFLILSVVHGCE